MIKVFYLSYWFRHCLWIAQLNYDRSIRAEMSFAPALKFDSPPDEVCSNNVPPGDPVHGVGDVLAMMVGPEDPPGCQVDRSLQTNSLHKI